MKPALAGRRVLITRAAHQAQPLIAAFEQAGAVVELLPLLEIVDPDDPAPLVEAASRSWDWLIFTSANAVWAFFSHASPPLADGTHVAVVGPATERAVRANGVEVDLTARKADADGLVALLHDHVTPQQRILAPQAHDARPTLVAGLRRLGVEITTVVAYAKRLPQASRERAPSLFSQSLGLTTFTSPRIVRHYVELLGETWGRRRGEVRAISIGPVTSAELRRHGIEAISEAARPDPKEMVLAARRAVGDSIAP